MAFEHTLGCTLRAVTQLKAEEAEPKEAAHWPKEAEPKEAKELFT